MGGKSVRRGCLALLLLLLVAAASGCTDESRAPTAQPSQEQAAPTEAEFCEAYGDYVSSLASATTGSSTEFMAQLKASARELNALGMPVGAPPDARRGLELTLDAIESLPDGATVAQLAAVHRGLTAAERASMKAFESYLRQTCPGIDGELVG